MKKLKFCRKVFWISIVCYIIFLISTICISQEIWEAKKRFNYDFNNDAKNDILVFYLSSSLGYFSVFDGSTNKILFKSEKKTYQEINLVEFSKNRKQILITGNLAGTNFLEVYNYQNNNFQKILILTEFLKYSFDNSSNENLLLVENNNEIIKYKLINNNFVKLTPKEENSLNNSLEKIDTNEAQIQDISISSDKKYLVLLYQGKDYYFFSTLNLINNQLVKNLKINNINKIKLIGVTPEDIIFYTESSNKEILAVNILSGEQRKIYDLKNYSQYYFSQSNFNQLNNSFIFSEDDNIYLFNLTNNTKTFIVRGLNPLYIYNKNTLAYKPPEQDLIRLLDLAKLNYEDIDFGAKVLECNANNKNDLMVCYNNTIVISFDINLKYKNMIMGFFTKYANGFFNVNFLKSNNMVINYNNDQDSFLYYINLNSGNFTKIDENINEISPLENKVYYVKNNNLFMFKEDDYSLQQLSIINDKIVINRIFQYNEVTLFSIQLFATDNIKKLITEINNLRIQGINDILYTTTYLNNGNVLYRVRTGLFKNKEDAMQASKKFEAQGFKPWVTKEIRGEFFVKN